MLAFAFTRPCEALQTVTAAIVTRNQDAVAQRAGKTRQAVCKHLKDLQALGHISMRDREHETGARATSEYFFHDAAENLTGAVRSRPAPIDTRPRDQTIDQIPSRRAGARGEGALDDFEPDFGETAQFVAGDVPALDPWTTARHREILGKFKDWHRANSRFPADLNAAFRTWLRDEPGFEAKKNRRAGNGAPASIIETFPPISEFGKWAEK